MLRCYNCKTDEYEKISLDAENAKQQAKETCEEAEKQRKYFYSLVNNYNFEIDKRVEKIVGRKTRFQRLVDWFEKLISMINSEVFFVPFLYAVGITVLAIFRNDIVRNDFMTAGKAVGKVFAVIFGGIKFLVLKAVKLSVYAENPMVQKILWWIILILMILIIITIILTVLFFLSFFDKAYLAAVLAYLGIVTFFGDLIKVKIQLNLVAVYFIFLAAFTVLKFCVPIIFEKIRR